MQLRPTRYLEVSTRTATSAGSDHVFISVRLRFEGSRWSFPDLMRQVVGALSDAGACHRSVLKMIWFVPTSVMARYVVVAGAAHFPGGRPPTLVLVQPPIDGADVSMLVWAMKAAVPVSYPLPDVAVCTQPHVQWYFVGGLNPRGGRSRSILQSARECYRRMDEELGRLSPARPQLVRTWIGIPEITGGPEGGGNYQAINLARQEHFAQAPPAVELNTYPASTGIGTKDTRPVLGVVACRTGAGASVVPIENAMQVPAFAYDARYSRVPPLFSRGMGVVAAGSALIVVSGTASIIGARTVHLGSAHRQTEQALGNIETLLSVENLSRAGLGTEQGGLESLRYVVVYVKDRSELASVRRICERSLPPGMPALYVEADICRDDLLVEIEGIAVLPLALPAREQERPQ
jgi:chorismate lyase / 3-hydroxybenzoate synthase